jgi:hypothetical protein
MVEFASQQTLLFGNEFYDILMQTGGSNGDGSGTYDFATCCESFHPTKSAKDTIFFVCRDYVLQRDTLIVVSISSKHIFIQESLKVKNVSPFGMLLLNNFRRWLFEKLFKCQVQCFDYICGDMHQLICYSTIGV